MEKTKKESEYVSTAEVSLAVGIAQHVLRALAAQGVVPVVRVHARCWRWNLAEVQTALERQGRQGGQEQEDQDKAPKTSL